MFIAMNRFKIKLGSEQDFIEMWKNRDSYLSEVPGFIEFHLLQGASHEEYTLFSSHASWESKSAFEGWAKSEAFKKAHAGVSGNRDVFAGPPQLETFEVVI